MLCSDKGVAWRDDPAWYKTGSSWLDVTPFAMRKMVNWDELYKNRSSRKTDSQ